ncbi:MAG: thiamine pyrophosphate-binding protein [Armatimonadota bacterium]|nr:thiamine pyrophosphate-binding protein [Armatimonadota bacterium]
MGARPHNVAHQIARFLDAIGTRYVFGLCGHTVIAMLDAFQGSRLRFVMNRHEQIAAHMADGYARASGECGVLLTHLGPGLTNAATGVANAALDSVPMLVLAGDVPGYFFGRHPHQEIQYHTDGDQSAIYRPFVKRVWRVTSPRGIAQILERAYLLAVTGRPGPVLISVAMDVLSMPAVDADPRAPTPPARPGLDPSMARRIAERLLRARRPVLYVGGGVITADAAEELRGVAEHLSAPVAYSLMGKGALPDDHPLALGMTGFWGTELTNRVTREADVLLAVGTRFAEADASSWDPRFTFAIPPTELIHIDIDPAEIGRSYPATIGAVADARAALRAVREALDTLAPGGARGHADLPAIQAERHGWRERIVVPMRSDAFPLAPQRILADVRAALPREGILVTDVGWNKNGVGQQFPVYLPRTHLTPGGLATMGFGPAAVMGAKLARPDRPCVAMVGDGAFSANPSVLATAVEQGIAVVWVVMNNRAHGTIAGLMGQHYGHCLGCEFQRDGEAYSPDFAAVARAYGAEGVRIERAEDLAPALNRALAAGRPVVLDVPMTNDPVPTAGHWDINDIYRW